MNQAQARYMMAYSPTLGDSNTALLDASLVDRIILESDMSYFADESIREGLKIRLILPPKPNFVEKPPPPVLRWLKRLFSKWL